MKKYVLIASVFFVSFSVFSESIERIEFSGLVRTSENALLNYLPLGRGDEYDEKTLDTIENELKQIGLFSEIVVNATQNTDGNWIIAINLEEKWTFIPVPFFSFSGGKASGGVFLIESNFLGSLQTLVAGYSYLAGGHFGLLSFTARPPAGPFETATFSLRFLEDSEEISDFGAGARASISTGEFSNITGGLAYSIARNGSLFLEDSGVSLIEVPLGFSFDNAIPEDYFAPGMSLSFGVNPGAALPEEQDPHPSLTGMGSFTWNLVPVPRHQFSFALDVKAESLPFEFLNSPGGSRGARTVDRDEDPVDIQLNADFEYQWAFLANKAIFTTLVFYGEAGAYHSSNGEPLAHVGVVENAFKTYAGVGAGFRLYLRRVAIPAFGFDYGYNFNTAQGVFSLSIGVGM